jgi:hypothetical protein
MNGNGWSRLAIIGAIVAALAIATAAVLLVSGDASFERLGLLFGLLGPTVLGFMSLLRADQAAKSVEPGSGIAKALDGSFEHRVRAAVRAVRDENPATVAVLTEREDVHKEADTRDPLI